MHDIPTLRLGTDIDEARSQIATAIDELLAGAGDAPRLAVVLRGETLPADVISALISGLRRLRERGGAITLRAEHEAAQRAIVLTGLDRVFALPLVPDDEKPHRSTRDRITGALRAAVTGMVALFAFTGLPAHAQAPFPTTDPLAIIARVMDRNPEITTYQSRVHIDLQLHSFPFLHQHLDGTTYYKRPSNFEVAFDHVPSYAKGFEKLYSDIGDPSNWNKRFVITYAGSKQFENRTDIELRMVQRVRGMIDHQVVLVDPNAWTIDEMEYHYYNGGVIAMRQHFSNIDGKLLLTTQDAQINIPYVKAVANGTYADYHTNVAIDDAVFTKKN